MAGQDIEKLIKLTAKLPSLGTRSARRIALHLIKKKEEVLLPLIEAMHYGIPCACSNTTALGEIGQGAAILFNPEKTSEIRDAICEILTSETTRKHLVTAGIRRAAEFSWQKAAAQMVEIAQKGRK